MGCVVPCCSLLVGHYFPGSSQVSPKSQILTKMKGLKQELMVALKQGAKHSNAAGLALLAGEKADL